MIGWFGKLAAMRGGGQANTGMASRDFPSARPTGSPYAPPAFTPTMPGRQSGMMNFMQKRGIGGYAMQRQQKQRQEAIDKYRFMIGMN